MIVSKNGKCTQRRVAGIHVCTAYLEKYLVQGR